MFSIQIDTTDKELADRIAQDVMKLLDVSERVTTDAHRARGFQLAKQTVNVKRVA